MTKVLHYVEKALKEQKYKKRVSFKSDTTVGQLRDRDVFTEFEEIDAGERERERTKVEHYLNNRHPGKYTNWVCKKDDAKELLHCEVVMKAALDQSVIRFHFNQPTDYRFVNVD